MTDQPPSILGRLRALSPHRGLTRHETRVIAERQAIYLLRLTHTQHSPVPTQILSDLGRIQLRADPDLDVSGLSFWNGTAWQLVAHADEHPHRQRFSLFHELKHVIDHPRRDLLYATETESEHAAEHFAACVLMPKIALTRAWCAGLQNLHCLARHFQVSPDAMLQRIHELGLGHPLETRPPVCPPGLPDGPRFAIAGAEPTPGGTR